MSRDQGKVSRNYATWMGKPVILSISAEKTKTDLPCTIIGESDVAVRVRIADQWDVEIYKEMIQAVGALPNMGLELARKYREGPNEPV
jgi:hypothetical protein